MEKYLFERLQQDLEKYTEHLHELSEKPIEDLINDVMRSEINNYTRVTERVSIFVCFLSPQGFQFCVLVVPVHLYVWLDNHSGHTRDAIDFRGSLVPENLCQVSRDLFAQRF
jgi:hypothetical protein